MRAVQPLAELKCRETGIVCVTVTNGHHFAALWTDVEPWAERGFVAITFVNSRPRMAVWGSKKAVLGTNPMAFACPRNGARPIIWDQASSVRSQGDVLIAARAKRPLPEGVGVDAKGAPTTDANAILSGGAILPFGGHKGASLAFMAEIMVGALGGGNLGFEDKAADYPGAVTCDTGQTVILIDPVKTSASRFFARVEDLVEFFADSGVGRLPADRRYTARRESERNGLAVTPEIMDMLDNG
jgi:delta1-piperideine-2-carboxylate reductase